jgi:hypothetical protein
VPALLEDMELDRPAGGAHRREHGEAVPDIGDRIVRGVAESRDL